MLHPKLNRKGKLIKGISTYRTWYDKGIQVMSVIRNMEMSDLAIMMAATKYLFGDYVPTYVIVLLGVGYWIFNAILNCSVGWFWEKNDGWRIEAEVFGKRNAVSRTVLVTPDGNPYDARENGEIAWAIHPDALPYNGLIKGTSLIFCKKHSRCWDYTSMTGCPECEGTLDDTEDKKD